MIILGIETSCDETAAAVVKDGREILSNIVSSQEDLHAKTGGIVPEVAARAHIEAIVPIINEALTQANIDLAPLRLATDRPSRTRLPIDAIAITPGPGLISSLMIGVDAARTLSFAWHLPLVTVSHIEAHIAANFLDRGPEVTEDQTKIAGPIHFPALALVVSGGHSELILITKPKSALAKSIHPLQSPLNYEWLGGTRDDAAGEAFDKTAQLLDLGYPGGPAIDKAAAQGDESAFDLPRPMIAEDNLDFSFAGLKTAVLRETMKLKTEPNLRLTPKQTADLAASFQTAATDLLATKTIRAARAHNVKTIFLAGGVAANQHLRADLAAKIKAELPETTLHAPPLFLCTDNAAMIAAAAHPHAQAGHFTPWRRLTAEPNLRLGRQ